MGIEGGILLSRDGRHLLRGKGGSKGYFRGSIHFQRSHLLSRVSLVFTLSLVISLTRLLASYSTMNEIHLASLRTLASQAGVMVDVVCAMRSILPAYHTSYHYAKAVFLSFIEQAGR